MAGFTESALQKKLVDLNESQQSIQTLSLWLIHHRKHHQLVIKTWFKELSKGDEHRRLNLMYLANDIIQNSKRKGPEYGKEFSHCLSKAFKLIAKDKCSERTLKKLERILIIWEERSVYEKKTIDDYRKLLNMKVTSSITAPAPAPANGPESPPPVKKSKLDDIEKKLLAEQRLAAESGDKVTLSPRLPPTGEPPEAEELIRALMELENAASVDVAVREKISKLPPEVSEVKLLSKLEDKEQALKLAEQVNAAVELLKDYNNRLSQEMDERRRVMNMLRKYVHCQKELLLVTEARLEEYKEKLIKIEQVRHEAMSHLSNLPVVPKLTDGLAPLPSPGDLFS